ncbi:MAG: glycoside hydrolase family 15 protein [Acidimicrobiales bacterium]
MAKDRARRDEDPGLPPVRPLRDYAFLGDGQRGALVDAGGDFAWMCFPGWSDPAVMAGLLGSGGAYTVAPGGRRVPGGCYEDGTLVWRGRWATEQGIVESRDALAFPGEERRAVILRRIRAIEGPARVRVALRLATDYGRRPLRDWRLEDGVWRCEESPVAARWSGAHDAAESGGTLRLELDLAGGDHHDLVLELVAGPLDGFPPALADQAWARTEQAWRSGLPRCDDLVAHDDVRRAFAVIRGMTPPNGATVAAATTSLPERDEGSRNYDYRYSWIRDTCYVGHAAASVRGAEALLDGAVGWVASRLLADGDATMPAYRTDGSTIPDERALDLPGYPGGYNVTGNRAKKQFQLDLFGESIVLLARAAELGRIDSDGWRAAEVAVAAIERNWRRDDAGIWEIDPACWTHSRLICVAGLKALARAGGPRELTARAITLGDGILSETDRTSLHPSGRWKRAPEDDRVDASLLLAEIRGALPPDDPRSAATRRAVEVDLVDEGYVYRYVETGKELGEGEGAFLICNFWMALAHSKAGNGAAAVRWFERGRGAAGSPGLFSEEYDVQQHQLRGNLPQVFVHALLIEAASEQPFDEASSQ